MNIFAGLKGEGLRPLTLGEYGFFHGLLVESLNRAPIEVVMLSSDAGDNASDTVGKAHRFAIGDRYSEEFVLAWKNTLVGLLNESPQPPVVVSWFKRHHFNVQSGRPIVGK